MASLAREPLRREITYTPRRASFLISLPDSVQLNRRANFRDVIAELQWLGTSSVEEQVAYLGLASRERMTGMLRGADISFAMAREIEWAMHKREGWMDEDHRGEVLED
jgi:hypothetical protein